MLSIKILVIFVSFISLSSSAKILGVFTVPSLSHQVVFRALTLELVKNGHEVTVITTNPIPDPPPNFHQIDVQNISYSIWNSISIANQAGKDIQATADEWGPMIAKLFVAQIQDPNIQQLIKRRDDFDLVLIETSLAFTYGYAHLFNAPFIGVASVSGMASAYGALGAPEHPILYPELVNKYLKPKTVYEKLMQCYDYYYIRHYFHWKHKPEAHGFMKMLFGNDVPFFEDIEKKAELFIFNHYPLITGIRPSVPNIISVGGLHIQPRKPLPKDLQQFLDDSKQGVIYMSFGTNVLSKDLPKDTVQIFLDVFSKLKYNVIWKFESDDLPGKPENVKLFKWLPQYDLLGHPNVKLFITQGGQQSIEEAVHSTTPLLGIPFYADQPLNVEKIKHLNIGLGLDITTLTRDTLNEAINTIIDTPSFKSNVTVLRDLINDEPQTGLEKAVWWIEYVIRHKGAKHLRSPSADVTWTEFLILDVVALLLATLAIIILVIVVVFKTLLNLIFGSKSKVSKQNLKNKKKL